MSFKIIGTGSCIPQLKKTNDDLAKIMDTSDEWIVSKTGIKSRYILGSEKLSDLATKAALDSLKDSGINSSELDLIICSTMQGDYITPSLACIIQQNIGATCPAFDINAACSGFVYALDIACGYFERKKVKKVLIISAEAMSRHLNWDDRATCVLFGDGAGAVVLAEGDSLLSINLTAKGDKEVMNIPCGKSTPFDTSEIKESYLYMNGQEVYRFAVNAMKNDIEKVVLQANLTPNDVTFVLPHQANMRIISAATKQLSIEADRVLTNMDKYGNMSSVSIVALLDENCKKGLFKPNDVLVFASFGGGLTTGACVIRWDKK